MPAPVGRAPMRMATILGVGAILLWAVLALLARNAAPLPPFEIAAGSFAVSGLLGIIALGARRQWGVLRQPPLVWLHGVGGLFGFHALYFMALAFAPPLEANLVNYSWPLLIVVLSAPVLGLRLGPLHLAGVVAGALGCAVLLGPGAHFPAGALPGFLCAGASALIWALYSVLLGKLPRVPTETVAGFCLVTAVLALLTHLVVEPTIIPDARQAMALLLLGIGPMGAAFFLWDFGMKRGDPRLLGTLAYATPLASTLLLIAAGEGAFTGRVALAALLIAGGGFLAACAGSRTRKNNTQE